MLVMEIDIPNWFWKKTKSYKFMFQTTNQNQHEIYDMPLRFGQPRGPRGFACDLRSFDRLDRTSAMQIFCSAGTGWPQDGSNQRSTLPTGWACSSTDIYIHLWFTMWGPGTIAQLVYNYNKCLFFGRCNYTVHRWDYKHTYKQGGPFIVSMFHPAMESKCLVLWAFCAPQTVSQSRNTFFL